MGGMLTPQTGGGGGGGLSGAAIDGAPAAASANLTDNIPASQAGVLVYETPQQLLNASASLAAAAAAAGTDGLVTIQGATAKLQPLSALRTAFGAGGALPLAGFLVQAPATAAIDTVQASADVVPFTIKRFQAGSASDLQQWLAQDGTVLTSITTNGFLELPAGTAVAPSLQFGAGNPGLYYDAASSSIVMPSSGSKKLVFAAGSSVLSFLSSGQIRFSTSGSDATQGSDAALSRLAASLLILTDTSGNTVPLIQRYSRAAKTANYAVVEFDSNTVFDNLGAAGEVDFSLPAAAVGRVYMFDTRVAQILKVIANGTDTIRLGAAVSAAGGNISGNAIGNWVMLVGFAGGWDGLSAGSWTVT